jgi:hypothetical protein
MRILSVVRNYPNAVTPSQREYRIVTDKIEFSEQFRDVCLHEFGIRPRLASNAVLKPDSSQLLEFDGLSLGLFVKKWENNKSEKYLLVIAAKTNDGWRVDFGALMHSELGDISALKPLDILSRFVERFGVEVTIASQVHKLFLDTVQTFELDGNSAATLFHLPSDAFAGFVECVGRTEQRGSTLKFHCGLLFAVDTYAYTRWLFGWEEISKKFSQWLPKSHAAEPDSSQFYLTETDIKSAYALAREMRPDDVDGQYELASIYGAFVLLKKSFGQDWYERNIHPESSPSFLGRDWNREDELRKSQLLLVQLAEAIFELRTVPGLAERIAKIRARSIDGSEALESLWFEFFVPFLIQKNGHKVLNFIPEIIEERTPDILIDFRSQLLPVEIKAKLEGANFSPRALSGPLGNACGQLPDTGPGVICLLIPFTWTTAAMFLQKAEDTINHALLRNRNCNAVFVWWPVYQVLQGGASGLFWNFRHFTNRHPRFPVPKITELIAKVELTDEMLEQTVKAYLPRVSDE